MRSCATAGGSRRWAGLMRSCATAGGSQRWAGLMRACATAGGSRRRAGLMRSCATAGGSRKLFVTNLHLTSPTNYGWQSQIESEHYCPVLSMVLLQLEQR